jgi:hypothetical protein
MPSDKRLLLESIRSGETTVEAVMAEHNISAEELLSWARRNAAFGQDGLRETRVQEYRLK